MLSFDRLYNNKEGTPIAFISGGKLDTQIIYLHSKPTELTDDEINSILEKDEVEDYITEEKEKKKIEKKINRKKQKFNDIERMVMARAINMNKDISDRQLQKMYDECEREMKKHIGSMMKLPEGSMFVPIPKLEERECQTVQGKSGSGKSRYMAMFARQWQKLFPSRDIYLFTPKEYDPAFEGIKNLKQLKLDSSLATNPELSNNMAGCLIIFDDIEALKKNKKLYTAVKNIQDEILILARQAGSYNLNSYHALYDRAHTATLHFESDKLVFFPKKTHPKIMKTFLDKHLGFGKNAISKILPLEEWVVYERGTSGLPEFIMNKNHIYTMDYLNKFD